MSKTIGLTFPETDKEPIICPVCGEEFANKKALAKHTKEVHPPQAPQ